MILDPVVLDLQRPVRRLDLVRGEGPRIAEQANERGDDDQPHPNPANALNRPFSFLEFDILAGIRLTLLHPALHRANHRLWSPFT